MSRVAGRWCCTWCSVGDFQAERSDLLLQSKHVLANLLQCCDGRAIELMDGSRIPADGFAHGAFEEDAGSAHLTMRLNLPLPRGDFRQACEISALHVELRR